ncbi:hypothetical protein JVT61DRAFT_1083 [Boletus reticuloceps]|uniref:Uncharacterized protein n=1 Tax=Boletus reticuloceps TaxID=495285 RepID=A0A8I2YR92_9AGAM|nr:hypothetical protein JVT61DRAFT_1083 [Boletus reticuloceps]
MTATVGLPLRWATSEKLHTSCIAVTAAGTRPKSTSRLRNRQGWQVSGIGTYFALLADETCLAQLQKFEDSAPESLEFERLKEHFEPFLRTSSLTSSSHLPAMSSHHLHPSSATAAASAALARDIPGVGKYNPLARSRAGRDRTANKDEMPEYKSRVETAVFSQLGGGGDDADVDLLRHMETVEEVAKLEQRWGNSWTTPPRSR